MINTKKKAIIITGATGSGKSKYALELAQRINGVIINCDSMQIYQQIPILSAQPDTKDQKLVEHLLYGYVDIFNGFINNNKVYSVGDYLKDLQNVLLDIKLNKTNKIPIIVGGTMLYVDAILNGLNIIPSIDIAIRNDIQERYRNIKIEDLFNELQKIDKKYALIVDRNNYQRIIRGIEVKIATGKSITDFWNEKKQDNFFTNNFVIEKILIVKNKIDLYNNINLRFEKMVKQGAIDEARSIYVECKKNNIDKNKLPKAIGLHRMFDYFDGIISLETAIDKIKQDSRHYAKRQMTWFRNRFQDFKKISVSI